MKTSIIITIIVALLSVLPATAQIHIGKSHTPMFFDKYQPARILLSNGKTLMQKEANIFLKNATLLYKQGGIAKQANVNLVKEVSFGDIHFIKVDTLLAYVVDSVIISDKVQNLLVCARLIDMEAYRHQVVNSQVLTDLTMGDVMGTTATEVSESDRTELPVINNYFYRINGKFIRVHERDIKRATTKEKYRHIKTIIQRKEFSWDDERALIQILAIMSANK